MNAPIYLSVVLSTYNDEKYIAKSIESILQQSYPYFEFIIVNDGSTDGTLSIIKQYTDKRIVLIDKANTGLSDSLNVGIQRAKYEWIARMDGDDIALPDRLERQVKLINNNVAVIGGLVQSIDCDGNIIIGKKKPVSAWNVIFNLRLGISKIVHPTALIRKDLIVRLGGYDLTLFGAEDLDLWMRVSRSNSIVNLNEIILLYRDNPCGVSKSNVERQLLKTIISMIKYHNKITRCLTTQEYEMLVFQIQRNSLYDVWKIVVHKRLTSNNIVRKLYTIALVLLQFTISKTVKINVLEKS